MAVLVIGIVPNNQGVTLISSRNRVYLMVTGRNLTISSQMLVWPRSQDESCECMVIAGFKWMCGKHKMLSLK